MTPAPLWFRIAAGVAALWMAMGCYAYINEMTATPDAMAQASEAMRAIMEGRPTWSSAAFAIAVWGGLIGAVMLFLRRSMAVPLLGLALLATMVSYAWPLLLSGVSSRFTGAEWGMSIFLIAAQAAIYWLAHKARNSGWLA